MSKNSLEYEEEQNLKNVKFIHVLSSIKESVKVGKMWYAFIERLEELSPETLKLLNYVKKGRNIVEVEFDDSEIPVLNDFTLKLSLGVVNGSKHLDDHPSDKPLMFDRGNGPEPINLLSLDKIIEYKEHIASYINNPYLYPICEYNGNYILIDLTQNKNYVKFKDNPILYYDVDYGPSKLKRVSKNYVSFLEQMMKDTVNSHVPKKGVIGWIKGFGKESHKSERTLDW